MHDWSLFFGQVFQHVGYSGTVLMQYAFDNIDGHTLGVEQMRYFPYRHPIREERIDGSLWRGDIEDLSAEVPRLVKHTMDRLFLAGGIESGCYFLDEEGNPRD